MRFFSAPTLPTVTSLPGSGSSGDLLYYSGAIYAWLGSAWLKLNNDATLISDVSGLQAALDGKLAATHAGTGGAAHADVVAAGASGFMTGADKTKLDGIATGATANTGTVTTVSVVTANGVSGSVATAGTTPAITLTLGAITPTSVVASGSVTGSNLSGTNTGDQTITLTGDVTGSGTGSFAATIGANKVTFAKFVAATAASFVGATGAGNFAELTPTQSTAQLNAMTAATGGAGGLKGLVPASAAGDQNKVLKADATWLTISTVATSGSAADLTGTLAAARLPQFTGGDVTSAAAGTATLTIGNSTVSLAKMANLAANSFIGNNTGSAATPIALTVAQAKTLLSIQTADVSGLDTALSNKQPLDGTLTALAGATWSSGTQILSLTAADTITLKTVGQAAGNILDKAAGDALYQPLGSYQTLDATLTALSALNATAGLIEQTGSDTFTKRTIGVSSSTDIPSRAHADTRYLPIGANWAPVTASGTGASQNIALPESGLAPKDVLVTIEGLIQDISDYSIVGSTLTITAPNTASIMVRKLNSIAPTGGWKPTEPSAADYTTVRYGAAGAPTIADTSYGSGVYLTFLRSLPGSSWRQQYLLKDAPAAPFRAEAKISNPWQTSNNWHMQGLAISSTNASDVGKHVRVLTYVDGQNTAGVSSKCTTIDGQEAALTTTHLSGLYTLATEHWMAIEYDGTNINTYWSFDGYAWYKNATEPASFFTGVPNLVGFGGEGVGSDGLTHHMWCPHFHVTTNLSEPMGLNRATVDNPLILGTTHWNSVTSTTLVNTSITSGFPFDTTIPQISEGTEVLNCTLTPTTTTSRVRVEAHLKFGSTGGANWSGFALFVNGAADAVDFTALYCETSGGGGGLTLAYEYVPGVTTPQTFSVRCGNGIGSRTTTMNGPGSTFGGVAKSTLSATEMVSGLVAPASRTPNPQTSSYTLVLADSATYIRMNSASANNLTVPPSSSVAFPIGTEIIVSQINTGQTTIVAGSGVTINTPETLKLRKRYSGVTLIKVATDEWDIVGDLELA